MTRIVKLAGAMIAAATLGAGLPAAAQTYEDTVQSTNPTANFRLSNPTEGSTVGGYTTSWQGSVTTGPGAPLASDPSNTGAVFDGVNSSNPGIITTSLSGNIPGTGSIVAWVNLAALPSTDGHILYVAGESQGGNDLDLQFTTDNTLRFYTGSGENTAFTPDSSSLVGQWHMITATYDGTQGDDSFRDIYWDGTLAASFIGGVNGAAKVDPFTIGYSPVFGGREFDGSIDEVAAYNYALTAGQVSSLFASSSNTVVTPPITAALPEPATWAMMIVGFGMIGAGLRYRRRRPVLRYLPA